MSSTLSMDVRKRWRSKSAILKRWITSGTLRRGDQICEIEVDGVAETVDFWINDPDDYGGMYFAYVQVGHEIGPFGQLLEYGTSVSGPLQGALTRPHTSARTRYVRREKYPRIFLSYRREDTEAYAGRLHESMLRQFGADDVFMDQFSIPPGEPYQWAIQQAAAHCSAMVVLIGPKWLTIADAGGRRLESGRDLVRREVCAAMDRGIAVVPVLAPGTEVLKGNLLPQDLVGLEELQSLWITARHWNDDVSTLVAELKLQLAL